MVKASMSARMITPTSRMTKVGIWDLCMPRNVVSSGVGMGLGSFGAGG